MLKKWLNDKFLFGLYLISVFSIVMMWLMFEYIDFDSMTAWTMNIWDIVFSKELTLFDFYTYTEKNIHGAWHDNCAGNYLWIVPWCLWNFPLWILTKIYNITPLFEKYKFFLPLKNSAELFNSVTVDQGGYGIIWNDDIDISCDELWANGEEIETPFDGLMAFSDATFLWNLNESTLRKAIAYGKLRNGVDVCKFGKQWVVSIEAMKREYGNAGDRV